MAPMSDSSNARPGAAPSPEDAGDALAVGSRLAEFEIREVLGAGGFGIVYRAWDAALQRDVALKEYMPVSLAGRSAGERVTLRSRSNEEDFALGLQSFVNEARLLARFDQPALVKVFRFWEANGTAYMAMPLYKGRTLRELRKDTVPRVLDDAWLRALIEPLLDALQVMHDAAVYHRDIAPDNILWCDDDRPVLLDFGAARLVLADRTQTVTAILKPQFAPIEQYAETQAMRQGPWTDLFALASTCYFMLTGRAPLPATARVIDDELEPLAQIAPPGCSPRLLRVLDWAMAVRPQDRPQSVAQFREALAGRIAVPVRTVAKTAAPADPAAESSGFEKTIQATMRPRAARSASASASTSATHDAPSSAPDTRPGQEAYLESRERSVMLPPKSRSPFVPLLLLVIAAAAAAGAWTTRQQWMPAVGLQAAAPPGAESASSAETSSDAAVPMPGAASAPAAEATSPAASDALPVANDAAASAAASPASDAASVAPSPGVEAPPHPARAKPSTRSRGKESAARAVPFVLPPPVLPPANESQVVTPSHPIGNAAPEAVEPENPAAPSASSASRGLSPREACAGADPAQVAACIKRLCDTEPRYQRYPACQRVRRQEELRQRGTSE